VPYQSDGWRYQQTSHGGLAGFEAPGFDDSAWSTGVGPFKSGGWCAIQSTEPSTSWAINSDMLARRHIALAPGTYGVEVSVVVDNDTLGRAVLAAGGGALTGAVCRASFVVGCIATGATTSVVQYQLTPGATNPVDDPVPYLFNAFAGGTLGRWAGGAVLARPAVEFSKQLVPNALERFALNHPRWLDAVTYSFFKSVFASGGQSIAGLLLNPATADAASRIKQREMPWQWR
jgi:hypothetical protein